MRGLPAKYTVALLCVAVILSGIVFPLNSSRMAGIVSSAELKDIAVAPGDNFKAPLPDRMHFHESRLIFPADPPELSENGVPLGFEGYSRHSGGTLAHGTFRVTGRDVYFSSFDGSSPLTNGRKYVLKQSAIRLPGWLLLSIWAAAAALWILLGYRLLVSPFLQWALRVVRGWRHVCKGWFQAPWLHLILIGMVAGLVFFETSFRFPIQSDCVVAIDPAYSVGKLVDYGVLNGLQGRRVLPTAQNLTYHLLGDSFVAAEVVYTGVFLVSVAIWYLILRHLFGGTPAVFGALFFLAYAGKYETLTWFAAGMYPVVMLLAILIFGVSLLRVNPWLKTGVIAVLLWLSLPFYEVLVMMMPVFCILFLGPCILEKRMPKASEWALSFGASIPILIHIRLLAAVPSPIWNRAADDSDYQISLGQKVWLGFVHSLDRTMGLQHLTLLWDATMAFFKFAGPAHPAMFVVLLLCAVALGLAVLGGSTTPGSDQTPSRHLYGLAGLYLAVFSGTITFVLGMYVPSRMTFLPSLGISLLLAYLIFLAGHAVVTGRHPLRSPAWLAGVALIALMCLVEAVSLSAIVKQRESARMCDQAIVEQICAIQPSVPAGSEIYVSMKSPKQGEEAWSERESTFRCGLAKGMLWYKFHTGINGIAYSSDVWSSTSDPAELRFSWLADRYRQGHLGNVYPFVVGEDLKVQGLRSVHVVDRRGNPVADWEFPSMQGAPGDLATAVTVHSIQ